MLFLIMKIKIYVAISFSLLKTCRVTIGSRVTHPDSTAKPAFSSVKSFSLCIEITVDSSSSCVKKSQREQSHYMITTQSSNLVTLNFVLNL